jgi:hypothetical protein
MSSLSRRRRWWLLLASALAIGIAEPYGEIAWKCRAGFEASEACVWGRSYFSLGRWLAPVLITPVAFIALLILALCFDWLRARSRP